MAPSTTMNTSTTVGAQTIDKEIYYCRLFALRAPSSVARSKRLSERRFRWMSSAAISRMSAAGGSRLEDERAAFRATQGDNAHPTSGTCTTTTPASRDSIV